MRAWGATSVLFVIWFVSLALASRPQGQTLASEDAVRIAERAEMLETITYALKNTGALERVKTPCQVGGSTVLSNAYFLLRISRCEIGDSCSHPSSHLVPGIEGPEVVAVVS